MRHVPSTGQPVLRSFVAPESSERLAGTTRRSAAAEASERPRSVPDLVPHDRLASAALQGATTRAAIQKGRLREMKRNVSVAVAFLALLAALELGSALLTRRAAVEAAAVQAPRFEVDPMWPKPLPNKWILGQTIGVSVDAQDHIWIIHRGGSLEPGEIHATTTPQTAQCCVAAPPIL